MNLKTFTTLIKGIENNQEQKDKAYKLGIDILSFDDNYYKEVVKPLMVEVFSEEGLDWIDWYLYERVSFSGKNLEAFDKEGKPICFDIPSLYATVKEYSKFKKEKDTRK